MNEATIVNSFIASAPISDIETLCIGLRILTKHDIINRIYILHN